MTPHQIISEVVKSVIELAAPGVNLLELEKRAETSITLHGAQPAIKGYHPQWAPSPFPSVICLGVNDIVGHSAPYDYVLQSGDLLSIDCAIIVNGQAADCGLTIPIGRDVTRRDEKLIEYTRIALKMGIETIMPGVKVTAVGRIIDRYLKQFGLVTSRNMNSHGIGKTIHESPTIPNFDIGMEEVVRVDKKGRKRYLYKEWDNIPVFVEGQIVCIEPHVTYNDNVGYKGEDGWTIRTLDRKKSCFAEHMVKVSHDGPQILTTHFKL